MVHNHYIKCQVCGAIIRIRFQVGYLKQHPVHVACGRCFTSLNGFVKIGQDEPSLEYNFENADTVSPVDKADYIVECSGEFPTMKPSSEDFDLETGYILSPFMRYSRNSRYEEFSKTISTLNRFEERWPQYKRILGLFDRGDRKFLLDEIWKILPQEQFQCRNDFEISRAVHMIEVMYFIGTLRKDIISDLSFSRSVLQLPPEQISLLIDFLNAHPGYSLKELQSSVYKIYDEFMSLYPNLIPAIFLQYCEEGAIDFKTEGTTTSSFDTIRQFSLDTYETLGNLLIIPVALNNIKYRNDYSRCATIDGQSKTLEEYCGFRKKSKRYQYCDSTELYTKELRVIINTDLRNAIGHNDFKYNTVTQEIVYLPDPADRSREETAFLLEFENEAVHLFQAITVICEYLYRLREFELIKNGHNPFPPMVQPYKKVGRNEPCPCGSGLKYKKCHGR